MAFDNQQPTLFIADFFMFQGLFPASAPPGDFSLGMFRHAAFNFAPDGLAFANGQSLQINQNQPLFSIIETSYGGDGQTNFALPDLRGAIAVGAGADGPEIGDRLGTKTLSTTGADLPASAGGDGTGQANMQPSVAVTYLIRTAGDLPVGGVVEYAGSAGATPIPGYLVADGSEYNIADYQALYDIIGVTYGGDGITTFRVPDLVGRNVVGVSADHPLGETFSGAIDPESMPAEMGGTGELVSNFAPGMALHYIISIDGTVSLYGGAVANVPMVGEIAIFAGAIIPDGWIECDGRSLSISENEDLFALIGTTYGGDGEETFSLPDLRGRVAGHMGTDPEGQTYQIAEIAGTDSFSLTMANIPSLDFEGTSAGETLYGGNQADTIDGGDGDDSIVGNDGDDSLTGGDGSDTLVGGAGEDTLMGGAGDDRFIVSDLTDIIIGGLDSDTITFTNSGTYDFFLADYTGVELVSLADGGSGSWTLILSNDFVASAANKTVFIGRDATTQSNIIDGASAFDADAQIVVNARLWAGDDTILATVGADTIYAGNGTDALQGSEGDDTIVITADGQISSDDTIDGGNGTDTLIFDLTGLDDGIDVSGAGAVFNNFEQIVVKNGGLLTFSSSQFGTGLISDTVHFEIVGSGFVQIKAAGIVSMADWTLTGAGPGSSFGVEGRAGISDTITASEYGDYIDGKGGGDLIDSGAGNDYIIAHAGDTIHAGAGNDNVEVASAADLVGTTIDAETAIGGDILTLGGGGTYDFSVLTGVSGFDVLMLAADTTQQRVTLTDAFVEGANGFGGGGLAITLTTSRSYALTIDGSALTAGHSITFVGGGFSNKNNTLIGGGGNDAITGDRDDDSIVGGAGNDTFNGTEGSDTIVGGTGSDLFYISSASDLAGDTLDGGSGVDQLFLNEAATYDFTGPDVTGIETITLYPDAAGWNVSVGDALVSSTENDRLTISGGVDVHSIGVRIDGSDLSSPNALFVNDGQFGGADSIVGGAGADSLIGGNGNDTLIGNGGADTIDGGSGSDSIAAGAGDSIVGGLGADIISLASGDLTGLSIDGSNGAAEDGTWDQLVLTGSGTYNFTGVNVSRIDQLIIGQTSGSDPWIVTLTDAMAATADNNQDGTPGDLYVFVNTASHAVTIDGSALSGTRKLLAFATGVNQNATFIGGAGKDELFGGGGNDSLSGGYGNDYLDGGNGADTLNGEDGNDTLVAGAGDSVSGGLGADEIDIGSMFDLVGTSINGHRETATLDVLNLTSSGTYLFTGINIINIDEIRLSDASGANPWSVTLGDQIVGHGDANRDGLGGTLAVVVASASQATTIDASSITGPYAINFRNDTAAGATVVGGGGDDTLAGGTGGDSLFGNDGNDSITGGDGNDTLAGGLSGDDTVRGGDGDDLIYASDTTPTFQLRLYGDAGDDTLSFDALAFGANLLVSTSGSTDAFGVFTAPGGALGAPGYTRIAGFERYLGSSGDDQMIAQSGASAIFVGNAGNDTLQGGNDGSDDIVIDYSQEQHTGSYYGVVANLSTVTLRADTTSIPNPTEVDAQATAALGTIIDAGPTGSVDAERVRDTFGDTDLVLYPVLISHIIGSAKADFMLGSDFLGEHFEGKGGDDWLFGAGGNDFLEGGVGNDMLVGGFEDDTLDGGADNDTIAYTGRAEGFTIALDANGDGFAQIGSTIEDTLFGIENITGGNGADSLTGNSGANILKGGNGSDTLDGGGGTDTAVFAGNWADYTIAYDSGTSTYSFAKGSWIDRVSNIELVTFDNGTFAIADLLNVAPVAVDNTSDVVVEDGDTTANGTVLGNDTDGNRETLGLGEILTVSQFRTGTEAGGGTFTTNAGTALKGLYGTLTIYTYGTYAYTLDDTDPDTQALNGANTSVDVFTYQVRDVHGVTDEAQLTISIGGTDDAPQITSTDAATIDENTELSFTVSAVDPDSTLTYSISGADAAVFAIDASSGLIQLVAPLDFEARSDASHDNVYAFTVKVAEIGDPSMFVTQAFTVSVNDLNEAPIIASNGAGATGNVTVAENTTAVTTVIASDPESTMVTYSISGTDAALFVIDATTGALAFRAAPDRETPVDADHDNIYRLTVTASAGTLTDAQALSITVGNVNETPVISSGGGGDAAAFTVDENATAVTIIAATDVDSSFSFFISGTDAARFAIDPATGALAFITAPDFEAAADADGDNVYEIVVTASDGTLTDTRALSITVADTPGNTIHGTSRGDRIDTSHKIGGKAATGEEDKIDGKGGNDTIKSGAGDDRLIGGDGRDKLTGGNGADIFVFNAKLVAANADTITDFDHNIDLLRLDDKVFRKIGDALTKSEFHAKAGAAEAHDRNDRIIYDTRSGKLYYDDDGNKRGGHDAIHFATLTHSPILDHGDFAIV